MDEIGSVAFPFQLRRFHQLVTRTVDTTGNVRNSNLHFFAKYQSVTSCSLFIIMLPRWGTRPLLAGSLALVAVFSIFPFLTQALVYKPELVDYNLNTNQQATVVTDFTTTRANKTYTPSPSSWRAQPVYTVLLDKFADGDPANNDYFQTMFEVDWRETQLRYGGDLKGLVSHLDYIKSMGCGLIFIAGTAFVNMPWEADST